MVQVNFFVVLYAALLNHDLGSLFVVVVHEVRGVSSDVIRFGAPLLLVSTFVEAAVLLALVPVHIIATRTQGSHRADIDLCLITQKFIYFFSFFPLSVPTLPMFDYCTNQYAFSLQPQTNN